MERYNDFYEFKFSYAWMEFDFVTNNYVHELFKRRKDVIRPLESNGEINSLRTRIAIEDANLHILCCGFFHIVTL